MTWATVQNDWNGFLDVVGQRMPCLDPGGYALPPASMAVFCADIARLAGLTLLGRRRRLGFLVLVLGGNSGEHELGILSGYRNWLG